MNPARIFTRRPVASGVALTAVALTAAALAAAVAVPVTAAAAQSPTPGAAPDFGPNVKIFTPSTPVSQISAYLKSIAGEGQFSASRHAVFFMPGTYGSAAAPPIPPPRLDARLEPSMDPFREFFIGRNPA